MRSISSRRLAEIGDDHLSDVPNLIREIRKRHRKVENDLRSTRACVDMIEDARASDQSKAATGQKTHDLQELQNLLQEEKDWLGRRSDISAQNDEEWQSLRAEFDRLRQSDRVWDLTREDVGKQYRSLATRGVNRRQTRLSIDTLSELSRTEKACRFKNANGPDIWLFPRVLVVDTDQNGVALIEWSDVNIEIYSTHFHEDESVPDDAEVVDHTWKYTNNDGTRDRRFNDNYRVPICRYSIIRLETASGMEEEFMFSSVDKTKSFAAALKAHLNKAGPFPIDYYEEAVDPPPEVEERRSRIKALQPTLREYQRRRKRKNFVRMAPVALVLVVLAAGLIYAASSGSLMSDADPASLPPRVNTTPDQVVGDSSAYSLTVVAEDNKLSPIRATVDGDVRRPYWVEKGEAVRFFWSERIILEGDLGATRIGLNSYLYRLPPEATQRAVFTDSTASSFMDSF